VHTATLLLELGGVLLGLGLLGRLAGRIGLSPIPLYLLAGLAFGNGGLLPLVTAQEFIQVGAEIGIILLLLLLGLEYSAEELLGTLRAAAPADAGDLLLNFPPGLAAGLLLGWGPLAAVVLGGVTYISSSGVIAKVLGDLGRHGNRETPVVLSILVLEDLAMAAYLPVVTVLLAGGTLASSLLPAILALAAVTAVLAATLRYGTTLQPAGLHSQRRSAAAQDPRRRAARRRGRPGGAGVGRGRRVPGRHRPVRSRRPRRPGAAQPPA